MSRRRLLLGGAVVVVVVGVAVGLIAWLGRAKPVRVRNVPTPTAAEAAACRRLSAVLPTTVGDGLKTRVVDPNSPLLHAWGTPAVVLRCGVGYPPNYPSAEGATEVNGITWDSTEAPDALIFTAVERTPRVSVAIPRHYQVPGDVLVSLADALKQATRTG